MNSESDESPNHALQRTPGFGVQLPSAAVVRPAQSRAVRPAMKPGTARAFASRRRAYSRAPGPESLSLRSLIWLSFWQEEKGVFSLLGVSNFARCLER